MSVVKLITQDFRNLLPSVIDFHPDLNFFVGDNGSGKSSLLEAIFLLGHGKSYRTSKIENLANYDKSHFVVSIKDDNGLQLGLSKDFDSGITTIKVNGERHSRLSVLVQNIAVQIITPESFKLFFGGPKERRRFIDLGMFHVEHNFSQQWREFSKVLKQRNACIRGNVDKSILSYWTDLFCQHSEIVAAVRDNYVRQLVEELAIWLVILLPNIKDKISVEYQKGWSKKRSLAESLEASIERENSYGYSVFGAHKFDVKFMLGKQSLENQLSRGQQKLFLLALTFAQAKLISKVKRVKPILLIDDIGAELDTSSRQSLSNAINIIDCQVVITAIEESVLSPFIFTKSNNGGSEKQTKDMTEKYSMFHVKHGSVIPVSNSVKSE
jgi:DNA replication and repair protein RecF